jgi:2'-5' RNA ligase
MRLFTAILFDEDIKTSLYQTVENLRRESKSGTFTTKDNLHLTVNFIGETKRQKEVEEAMEQAVKKLQAGSFLLSIRGFGRFKRREGDIYWIGVAKENTLWKLQKELTRVLKETGFFDIDEMEYTPHLTLGRRVKTGEHFNEKQFEAGISPLQMRVAKISLMKSERIEGKLVYTEIYHVELAKD